MITEETVKKGLDAGAIEVRDGLDDYGVLGVGCKIGDYAFYFKDEDEVVLRERLAKRIAEVLADMREDFPDEVQYYDSYLHEALAKEVQNMSMDKDKQVITLYKKGGGYDGKGEYTLPNDEESHGSVVEEEFELPAGVYIYDRSRLEELGRADSGRCQHSCRPA